MFKKLLSGVTVLAAVMLVTPTAQAFTPTPREYNLVPVNSVNVGFNSFVPAVQTYTNFQYTNQIPTQPNPNVRGVGYNSYQAPAQPVYQLYQYTTSIPSR